jgi:hypothetical protein
MCRINIARDYGLVIDELRVCVVELCRSEVALKKALFKAPYRVKTVGYFIDLYNYQVDRFIYLCKRMVKKLEILCQVLTLHTRLDTPSGLHLYQKLRWWGHQLRAMSEMAERYTQAKLKLARSNPNAIVYESPLELFYCYVAPVFRLDISNGTIDTEC